MTVHLGRVFLRGQYLKTKPVKCGLESFILREDKSGNIVLISWHGLANSNSLKASINV